MNKLKRFWNDIWPILLGVLIGQLLFHLVPMWAALVIIVLLVLVLVYIYY